MTQECKIITILDYNDEMTSAMINEHLKKGWRLFKVTEKDSYKISSKQRRQYENTLHELLAGLQVKPKATLLEVFLTREAKL